MVHFNFGLSLKAKGDQYSGHNSLDFLAHELGVRGIIYDEIIGFSTLSACERLELTIYLLGLPEHGRRQQGETQASLFSSNCVKIEAKTSIITNIAFLLFRQSSS